MEMDHADDLALLHVRVWVGWVRSIKTKYGGLDHVRYQG
jgi:hypothetical protein